MDDSFEKAIQESLNNPPDYPFDEQLWEEMEEKLGHVDKRRSGGAYPFWLIPLVAGLVPLIMLFFLYRGYQKQAEQIAALEMLMSEKQAVEKEPFSQKETTIIYDTVYRTRIVEGLHPINNNTYNFYLAEQGISRYIDGDSAAWTRLLSERFPGMMDNKKLADNTTDNTTDTLLSGTSQQDHKAGTIFREEDEAAANQQLLITPLLPSKTIAFLDGPPVDLPPVIPSSEHKKERRFRNLVSPLMPSAIAVSGSAGTFTSDHLPGLEKQSNFIGSLSMELAYGNHLSLLLGGEYLTNSFSLKEDDETNLGNIPVVPPNDPDDDFESLEGDIRYWQFPIGLKYTFLDGKRLRPVLGLGVIGIWPTRSVISTEYEDDDDNYYLLSQTDLLTKSLQFSDAWLSVGLEYTFARQWSLLLDISAQQNLRQDRYVFDERRFRKAKLGLKYRF